VGCAVGKVTMQEVMRSIWPFYGVMFVVLMLVTYIRRSRCGCPGCWDVTIASPSQNPVEPQQRKCCEDGSGRRGEQRGISVRVSERTSLEFSDS
jgi:hypothetical protein